MASGDSIYAISTSPSGYNDLSYYTDGITWANAIGASPRLQTDGATATRVDVGTATYGGGNYYVNEILFAFDVSDIPSGSSITAATLAVRYVNLDNAKGNHVEEIFAYDWGSGISTADWRQGGASGWLNTNLSSRVAYRTPSSSDGTSSYRDFTSDGLADAVADAVADDGILRLVAASNLFRSDSAPSGANGAGWYSADTSYPQRLIVTYTAGSSGIPRHSDHYFRRRAS